MRRVRRNAERLPQVVVLTAASLLLAALPGCSVDNARVDGAGSPTVAAGPAAPLQAPAAPAPATVAAETLVKAALAKDGAGSRPSTEQIRAILADAGFPPETIEVTASRTPTGLAADAVEAAVRQDKDCVIAQLRNGAVAVTVLPVLAGGHCLAGSPA